MIGSTVGIRWLRMNEIAAQAGTELMIVGNPAVFAIESCITQAYACLSFRALGFFNIYVSGCRYGEHSPDATLLACSFDEVQSRIASQGTHVVPFAEELDAGRIADAFRNACYAEAPYESYFGIPLAQFCDLIHSKHVQWAPDGDEAFDDGSYVLQFDVQDRVRLIAFKTNQAGLHDPSTLSDRWVCAREFYEVLQQWHDGFEAEWASSPKTPG